MASTSSDAVTLQVAGHDVEITHPDKPFFPKVGVTKLDLCEYYLAVGDAAMAAMEGRPVLLQRFPNGVGGNNFFQKRIPDGAPDWLTTATHSESLRSASDTSRPRSSGMPRVLKNPGVTKRRLAIRVSVGSGAQLARASSLSRAKSRITGQIPPRIVIGRKLIYDAPLTPGSARVSDSTRS